MINPYNKFEQKLDKGGFRNIRVYVAYFLISWSMEGLISQIKEQEEINFSLELVEESKELSEKVQIFCEQIINRYSD